MQVTDLHPAEIAECITCVCSVYAKEHARIERCKRLGLLLRFLRIPAYKFFFDAASKGYVDQAIRRDLITHMLNAYQVGDNETFFYLEHYFAPGSPILKLKSDWMENPPKNHQIHTSTMKSLSLFTSSCLLGLLFQPLSAKASQLIPAVFAPAFCASMEAGNSNDESIRFAVRMSIDTTRPPALKVGDIPLDVRASVYEAQRQCPKYFERGWQ